MENNIISYLTFRIGAETFGTNVKNIQNIIEYNGLTKVPQMPPYMMGVTNLRGEVLPVIDSRIKLGIPTSEATTNSCIIVLELTINGTHTKAGFFVDEVLEVLEIRNEEINEPPKIGSDIKTKIINGVFPVKDKFILLLNIDELLESSNIPELKSIEV